MVMLFIIFGLFSFGIASPIGGSESTIKTLIGLSTAICMALLFFLAAYITSQLEDIKKEIKKGKGLPKE